MTLQRPPSPTSLTTDSLLCAWTALVFLYVASCGSTIPKKSTRIANMTNTIQIEKLNQHASENAKISLLSETPWNGTLTLRRYQLGNGLRIVLLADESAPVFSYHTWFGVGSRHERPGKTGLAHLFEHLMFNESEDLAAGEFDRKIESRGGETNAATWVDWTYYYNNLPSSELSLAVGLESSRMAKLILREPQVRSEKEVVANERRFRVDDDVEGKISEVLFSTAFEKHPYGWPTIGWMQDIEGFTVDDCRDFYKKYYAPNNAVVAVVGDFQEIELLKLIQSHYGTMSASKLPASPETKEPAQQSERKKHLELETSTEKLQIGYHGPAYGTADHAALTVVAQLLLGGRSTRLHRQLISEGEIATEAQASIAPFHDPGLFEIWVSMRGEHETGEALELIDQELNRLATERIEYSELDKIRNKTELAFYIGMDTASGKAEQLGFHETVSDDARATLDQLETIRSVTRADIQRVTQKYLVKHGRTVVTVTPTENASKDTDASPVTSDESATQAKIR